jgi:hypothetical protein
MLFKGIANQEQILKTWAPLINARNDIKDESVKMSTALVLENTQNKIDEQFSINNSRGLITEAGITTAGTMGPFGDRGSLAGTAAPDGANGTGDARVPSIVIPMIRRIFPQLIAHKLVGVQPMQGPIGMAFAFRARYGRNSRGVQGNNPYLGEEIGYVNVHADHTGQGQNEYKYGYEDHPSGLFAGAENGLSGKYGDQGQIDASARYLVDKDGNPTGLGAVKADPQVGEAWDAFFGKGAYMGVLRNNGNMIGDGADTSDAENWAIGSTMPEAGFEFLKATVTAKTRKLGVKITRETEEDMKAMQGLNAQNEISDIISYEIAQEIDRQLLAEIVQAAIRANNFDLWTPAEADGRNQSERTDALYTTILNKSAKIAVQSRRGAANWCVCSPAAAALLEAHIYQPLGVAGGLGNAKAFGSSIDNNIGVTDIGSLRNGTIKLYRDTLAPNDYILLGYKGNNIYDAGVIYLPYIPLELMHAQDPFTMNPMTAARTRYGVTTNLFGAGQFYQFIALKDLNGKVGDGDKLFIQP